MLLQAAVETQWGGATRKGTNNLYNIKRFKGDDWGDRPVVFVKGATENINGKNKPEPSYFRVYSDMKSSVEDRTQFFKHNPKKYSALFKSPVKGNMSEEIKVLVKAGYATDPGYAGKMDKIYKQDRLQVALKFARGYYGY
jgi:flagellum-specific peptidoglycan hydrolase FlgJ